MQRKPWFTPTVTEFDFNDKVRKSTMDEGEREVVRDEFGQLIDWHVEITKMLRKSIPAGGYELSIAAAVLMLIEELRDLKVEIHGLNPGEASEKLLTATKNVHELMDKVAELEQRMP